MLGNVIRLLTDIRDELRLIHEDAARTNALLDVHTVKLMELTGQASRLEAWLTSLSAQRYGASEREAVESRDMLPALAIHDDVDGGWS